MDLHGFGTLKKGSKAVSSRRFRAAQGRADSNQRQLILRAKELGFTVLDLSAVGKGVPDLLVSSPAEMWLVEVKRLAVMGLGKEFKDKQREFYGSWKGKDMLVWYELGDVDLLYLLCERAGHFHGEDVSIEAALLCQGRSFNVLSREPKRRGGSHSLPSNVCRLPNSVQNIGEGFTSSVELSSACEVAHHILTSRDNDGEDAVLENTEGI